MMAVGLWIRRRVSNRERMGGNSNASLNGGRCTKRAQ